jgi:RNase adapter protein RapZ
MKEFRLVILSGPSGAGKSTAMNVLEDMHFFCVDNLPVTLLPTFLELSLQSREIARLANVIDVREREFLKDFPAIFENISTGRHELELLYLEASDQALVRRFSETRRKHPLAHDESPLEGINRERALLEGVKLKADKIIDTSDFNVHQLKEAIKEHFAGPNSREKITINLISFGYRYGIPPDVDLVMDVRFLPNPYFVDAFKELDGSNKGVRDFVLGNTEARGFSEKFLALLDYLIPLYWKEGKAYLTIAIGCTGGKHRSVAMVDYFSGSIKSHTCTVRSRHRDLEKP